ncbi:hypothetical protein [Nocardioides sp. SYSU DS0663]|uniref:hypothetical protein n=1 Tax=Nocardioides sp. SYSU DS0663 TaxID=3416445 RepID=UPI003F4C4ACA
MNATASTITGDTGADWPGALVVFLVLAALALHTYVTDVRPRRRRRSAESVEDIARSTGVLRGDHTPCHGGCGTVLCLDEQTCPGHVPSECPHHEFLCGDCRLEHCADCRINARDDAGVLG